MLMFIQSIQKPLYPFFILVLIFCGSTAHSQTYTLKGQILNKEKIPLEFIRITLFQTDTVAIDHAVTDSLGVFSFTVSPGSYTLVGEQFKNTTVR